MERYQNRMLAPEERAKDLLNRMTLEEKIDQLGCAYIKGTQIPDLDELLPCSVGSIGMTLTLNTAKEFRELIEKLQKYVIQKSRFGIPALIHNETLSGALFVQATSFPPSLVQASTWDPGLVREMTECIREECLEVGFRQALSPVFDISRDPRWGRMMETYGEDETLASALGVAFVEGMQGDRERNCVAATGKHFIGHGLPEGGLNQGQNCISQRELVEVHCKPFQASISKAGMMCIMNSYGAINREAVIGSSKILTNLLREQLRFEGLLVSDYYSINRMVVPYNIAKDALDAGIKALKAGLDVEYPVPYGYTYKLKHAVEQGILDEALVDRSALRVLTIKFALGLFENPYPEKEFHEEIFLRNKGEEICRKITREAIVLLKNKNHMLPLNKKM